MSMSESQELPGMLQVAINTRDQVWPHTIDAQVWAKEWAKHIAEHPGIPTDEATMIGWFANAIMAGYDTAQMRTIPLEPTDAMLDAGYIVYMRAKDERPRHHSTVRRIWQKMYEAGRP